MAQSQVFSRTSILDFYGQTSAPAAPPANYGRLYYNSTTGQFQFITSSGTTIVIGGAVNSAGLGGFFSHGQPTSVGNTPQALVANPQEVYAWQFQLNATVTLSRASVPRVSVSGGAASTYGYAIYNSSKQLVCSATGFDGTNTAGTPESKTFTAVTLSPGVYYFAWTASSASLTIIGYLATNIRQLIGDLSASGYVRVGLSSTSATAGVFPSTLGTLSGGVFQPPLMFWEIN